MGKLKDPAAVPIIEQGLEDEENCVRCAAGLALRDNNRPESTAKMLAAVERFPNHPLIEVVFKALPRIRPLPRAGTEPGGDQARQRHGAGHGHAGLGAHAG